MKVAVIGGGNSAHVAIAMLSAAGHQVSLLTNYAEGWAREVVAEYQTPEGALISQVSGRLAIASSSIREVVFPADFILLCLPVAKYRERLHQLAPCLDPSRRVVIAALYGQAGFNWMMEEIKGKYNLGNVDYFTFGLIPWIARTKAYGRCGVTYGGKQVNVIAQSKGFDVRAWQPALLDDLGPRWFGYGETAVSDDFISLTLSVDNQIIHPSRCYGLYQEAPEGWASLGDVPLFYRDYTDESADSLARLDADYEHVREAIRRLVPKRSFPYMLNYLDLEHVTYRSRSTSIKDSFVHSPTLTAIGTPVEFNDITNRWELIKNHRFFRDDTQYGICIGKWFADQLRIETPQIDAILQWVERLKGQRFLTAGKRLDVSSSDVMGEFASGVPAVYGFEGIEETLA